MPSSTFPISLSNTAESTPSVRILHVHIYFEIEHSFVAPMDLEATGVDADGVPGDLPDEVPACRAPRRIPHSRPFEGLGRDGLRCLGPQFQRRALPKRRDQVLRIGGAGEVVQAALRRAILLRWSESSLRPIVCWGSQSEPGENAGPIPL